MTVTIFPRQGRSSHVGLIGRRIEQGLGEAVEIVIVLGLGIAVTAVAPKYQCAEMERIARGRGRCRPKARHASVKPFDSSVFIGLPWPMKRAGIDAIDLSLWLL